MNTIESHECINVATYHASCEAKNNKPFSTTTTTKSPKKEADISLQYIVDMDHGFYKENTIEFARERDVKKNK